MIINNFNPNYTRTEKYLCLTDFDLIKIPDFSKKLGIYIYIVYRRDALQYVIKTG